ncbi:MAG TPA: flavin reductase family protein [Cellulomonas sp.]|uniref:flavin reductase family protein n=1 Tax=Cellulomonas sp. TaxID=40001 RepID=UPI002E337A10|nr:flavin reductase family protein [Cellulomonas sp.]HEX5331852.1 flavin reductase family protein [Cellulomonas sp.]
MRSARRTGVLSGTTRPLTSTCCSADVAACRRARARTVAVSFLADDQDDVSARFATRGTDRFAAGGWSLLDTGEPVIDGAVAWVWARCTYLQRHLQLSVQQTP